MHHIESLKLSEVVSFKSASVQFNKNRITFVRGLNMDSDPAAPSSNGAGKSLLLSCPSNVFYFTPPLSNKKKAKKELLGKGSSIQLTMTGNDGHKYDVVQTANKYTIKRDGADLEIRTVPLAERFIREKIFPIPELLYYTTCYISTQRAFPMQSSSDNERLAHMTEIFSLDDYDNIKRYFLNRLGELRESELKLQMLERDLLETEGKLKRLKRADTSSSNVDALKATRARLDKEISKSVDAEFSFKVLLKDLNALLTIELELSALRKTYKSKLSPKKYSEYLREERKLVRDNERYESQMEEYRRTTKETQKKIDSLGMPDKPRAKLEKQLRSCDDVLEELRSELSDLRSGEREYNELCASREKLLDKLKELGYSEKNKPDMSEDYAALISECRTTLKLRRLLDHAHDNDSKCPTCFGEIDVADVKSAIKSAEKRLPTLEEKRDAQQLWKEYSVLRDKIRGSSFDPDRLQEVRDRIALSGPVMTALKSGIRIWENHENLTRALKEIRRPEEPKKSPTTELSLEAIDEAIELCASIQRALDSKEKLIEGNEDLRELEGRGEVSGRIAAIKEDADAVGSKLSKLRKELGTIVTELDTATSAQHEHGVYVAQRKKLIAKIDELKPKIEDKHLLEILVKAYSSKGVKTNVANDICSLLEQNLNAYSNLIFNEPFVFSIEASSTGISIMVDRGNGHISDVRLMSGAESNAFRMLFVLSLLPLLPDHKRISMLTLDEPCAHMDDVSRTKFLHVFLPALSEVVPNIYIITPNHEDHCEGSNQWLIRKEEGKSRVIFDGADDVRHDVGTALKRARKAAAKTKRK